MLEYNNHFTNLLFFFSLPLPFLLILRFCMSDVLFSPWLITRLILVKLRNKDR